MSDPYNFDNDNQRTKLLQSYNIDLEKGGAKAFVGEKREFGGRVYVKTTAGWKYFGKGSGSKAQQHDKKSPKIESIPKKDQNKIIALAEKLVAEYDSIGVFEDYTDYFMSVDKAISSKEFNKRKQSYEKADNELSSLCSNYSADQINSINNKALQSLNTAGDLGFK